MKRKLMMVGAVFAMAMGAWAIEYADTVVYGTIRTAEAEDYVKGAIAIKDGKYVYVGDEADVEEYIGLVTEIIDHRGKGMVMPGCTDGHSHYTMKFGLANMKGGILFDLADDKTNVLKKVEAAALAAQKAGKTCVFGFGWSLVAFRVNDQLTLAELDAATHGLSLVIFAQGGHHAYCNSECLKRCKILSEDGKTVLIKEIDGGLLELDENGYPTGFVDERVTGYLMRMGGINYDEIVDDEVAEASIRASQDLLLSTGYTTALEGWSNILHPSNFYAAANRMDTNGTLKLVFPMTYEVEPWQTNMTEQIDYLDSLNKTYRTAHVLPEYLKVFMDGCVESMTGAMIKPYKDGTEYKSFWSTNRLADITRECNARGLTVHTHAMGDAAIKETADAYIQGGDGTHRNCLVHLRHVRKEDFQRFADNNIACSAGFTWHVASPDLDELLKEFLDEEYIKHAYPMKSFFDAGVKVSSHSDFPANEPSPQDPFGIMQVAVTGIVPDPLEGEKPYDTNELVTVEQVFQSLTLNGAWQLGLENERGSIKVGKYADFVLADQDVFTCAATDIGKTKVVSTWFEGKKVYQAPRRICSEKRKLAKHLYEIEYQWWDAARANDVAEYLAEFMEMIDWVMQICDYLFPYQIFDWYEDALASALCTSCRNGNFIGRNFDWAYDDVDECVMRVPAAEGRLASVGVASWFFPKWMQDAFDVDEFLPELTMDGVNEKGVAINVNVVPAGDNGETTGTNFGAKRLCAGFAVRTVLDNATSAAHAVEILESRDIYSIKGLEFHWMISDATESYIVECVKNELVVLKAKNARPKMANFYVSHSPNVAEYEVVSDNGELTEDEHTPHAMGIERYARVSNGLERVESVAAMFTQMTNVWYKLKYLPGNEERYWSDLNGQPVPGGEKDQRFEVDDDLYEARSNAFKQIQANYVAVTNYEAVYGCRTIDPKKDPKLTNQVVHTVHTSIYDLERRELTVCVQEDVGTIRMFNLFGELAQGNERNPWLVGTEGHEQEVMAWTNGTDTLVVEGSGAVGSAPWAEFAGGISELQKDKGVTGLEGIMATLPALTGVNGLTFDELASVGMVGAAKAGFSTIAVEDGVAQLGVMVCTNGDLTATTESWGKAKVEKAEVEDGDAILTIPATAEKGFMILKSR